MQTFSTAGKSRIKIRHFETCFVEIEHLSANTASSCQKALFVLNIVQFLKVWTEKFFPSFISFPDRSDVIAG